jgi:uncharacterized membrane protein
VAETVADRPRRSISIVGRSIYGMLLPVPVGNLVWLDFSNWLILFGLVFGAIGAIVLLIDFTRSPALRNSGARTHLLFFYAALLVELFNAFVHDRDGWTAVAGTGMILSIVGALLILVAGWLHRPAVVEPVR